MLCRHSTSSPRLFLSLLMLFLGQPQQLAMAKLVLPTFLSSHMVLQREPQQARLWGWAAVNATVSVTLTCDADDDTNDNNNNLVQVQSTIADEDSGAWQVDLAAQPAKTNCVLQFDESTPDDTTIILKDIAFGDVYLCSGQSNMEMSIAAVFNAAQEIDDSANYPHLRLASVQKSGTNEPQPDANTKTQGTYIWARSSPQAMNPTGPFSWFSASCYFFGRDMYQYFKGEIPIGLVASSFGGTRVECWSSPDAMADDTCGGITTNKKKGDDKGPALTLSMGALESEGANMSPSFLRTAHHKEEENSAATITAGTHQPHDQLLFDWEQLLAPPVGNHCNLQDGTKDSQLWNAMIYHLLNMRFAGTVWYQGEANADGPDNYACRFPAMIADWRVQFNLPTMPFVYVQLAAFETQQDWPLIRAAQDAALRMSNVGVAVAIDIGDPESTQGPIHPRRKQEVGRRLALSMRAIQYPQRAKDNLYAKSYWTGPILQDVHIVSDNFAVLEFDPKTTTGMDLHATAGCTDCCNKGHSPIQTLDSTTGNWTMASVVEIQGNNMTIQAVNAPAASTILGVHVHWENYPQCALLNGQGGPDDHQALPAPPTEWCLYPVSGEEPWTGKACGTAPAPTITNK